MERERISDLYEDFEPEMRIWPYWVLGLLIPLVPFGLSFSLSLSLSWQGVLKYFVSVLPLVFTAVVMKDGEKAWLLPFSGGVYASAVLILWVNASLEGAISYPLGLPLALVSSPSILSLIAFSFFQKRKRGKWVLPLVFSIFLSSALTFLSVYSGEGNIVAVRGVYPALLLLLSFSVFGVTRRSDSTPWFVFLILLILLISSSLFHSGIMSLFEGKEVEGATIVSSILGVFVHDTEFWYTLTFLFVFSGLSGKSSYRTVVEEVKEEDVPLSYVNTISGSYPEEKKYSFPPSSSRFAPETQVNEEAVKEEKREYEERPKRDDYQERPKRDDYHEERPDDKWYQFIQGGVREERREDRREDRRYGRDDYREERRRDDYPSRRRDPYYDEDERERRRDDYYSRPYYRDVEDRRYRDDRDYRDDRYYRDVMDDRRDRRVYPRRDERDRRRDDEYRDRRDPRDYDDWD